MAKSQEATDWPGTAKTESQWQRTRHSQCHGFTRCWVRADLRGPKKRLQMTPVNDRFFGLASESMQVSLGLQFFLHASAQRRTRSHESRLNEQACDRREQRKVQKYGTLALATDKPCGQSPKLTA